MKPEHKLLTLDIKDLYVNIPINETIHLTTKLLNDNGTNTQDTKDLINILRTTLHQNYFQYNNTFYKPKTGIAMGSLLSGIVAEILERTEQIFYLYKLYCGFNLNILINLTGFKGTQNSMRILYNTLLLTVWYAFLKALNNWCIVSLYSHFFSSI
jgi:hypothetical protein